MFRCMDMDMMDVADIQFRAPAMAAADLSVVTVMAESDSVTEDLL